MSAVAVDEQQPSPRHAPSEHRIPLMRLVKVELRSMFNTRAGVWLMATVAIVSFLATVGVILFAADSVIKYGNFASAIGFPLSLVLPVIAILSVTSEWSQRTGLTTFTIEPRRSRTVTAKALASIAVGIVGIAIALAIGAVGNFVGAAVNGLDPVWDMPIGEMWKFFLANVLGMMLGFAAGVLIRNSPAAIVAYFMYVLALPTMTGLLAAFQDWFDDLQPWVEFNTAQMVLLETGSVSGEEWAQLGTSGFIWLVLPLVIGIWTLMRAEVK